MSPGAMNLLVLGRGLPRRAGRVAGVMLVATLLGATGAGVAPSAALAAPGVAAGAPLHWSAAAFAERPPYANATPIDEVSCATASDCVAIDAQGDVLTSASPAGGAAAWHLTPRSVPPIGTSTPNPDLGLSCVAAAPVLCVGVDNGSLEVSTHPAGGPKAWHTVTPSLGAESISCTSATFCLASGNGLEVSTDPAGGAAAWHPVTEGGGTLRVSCASQSFCAGVADYPHDESTAVQTSTNPAGGESAWKVTDIGGPVDLAEIACPSTRLCVATDIAGDVITSTRPGSGVASAWHAASIGATITSITCPSTKECVAAAGGALVTSTDPTGGAKAWHVASEPWVPGEAGLSCPTIRLCVAGNQDGQIVTSASPGGGAKTWAPPVQVDGGNAVNAVACPSATLCVAGDAHGNVLTSTDPAARRWKLAYVDGTPPSPDLAGITGLRCPGRSLCVATDPRGDVITSTDPAGGASAWHLVHADPASLGILGLRCPGTSLCVGYDSSGNVVSSTHPAGGASAWHVAAVSAHSPFTTLYCPTTRLCVAGDQAGDVWTSTDPAGRASAWHSVLPSGIIGPSILGMSCAGTTVCAATDSAGQLITSADPTGGAGAWQVVDLPLDSGLFDALACPSTKLCFAQGGGDPGLEVWYSTDPAGGATTWKERPTDSEGPFICPSARLCIGPANSRTKSGVATATNPTAADAWTGTTIKTPVADSPITTVGCASTSLCVAGDSRGDLYTGRP